METNGTLYEEIISDDFPTPSTSTFVADSQPGREIFISGSEKTQSSNATDVSVSSTTPGFPTHVIFENFFNAIESVFEENAWLLYAILALGLLVVITVVLFIVLWIVKHKKRVIQQDNDPVLASAYSEGINWKKYCLCCRAASDKQSQLRARQNSASNLDPYKRPPLPPIGAKPGG
ncbi:hypothetical protein OESDEN_03138 [Oesophagostomum dentatum]|uniref:Uncharacterized protein n=1 Tax=Oesophagostomum dentatum TaxID=61180 RepID=A0A0B1THY6_OESDE|nr:hypothetical protein OESDEN_03138 [Oesophagostomum dentatum]